MSQKTETKKEEFRKYLESAGVLDALTKVLVGLYEEPEKPSDPLVFLKQQLHGGLPEPVDAEMLRRENEELQRKNRELEAKVVELTAALAKHEREGQGDAV
jgi:hypothetical protein